jgi:hypothetical protein
MLPRVLGNSAGGASSATVQELCGLTSQPVDGSGSTLFREVTAAGRRFLAGGQDAAMMTRSIPIKEVLDEAMLAYAQNGEALRPEQGYPVRLFLPGIEGNASVKWLHRIELADQPFMTREETSKYTDPLADGRVRQFSLAIDARSVITSPSCASRAAGWIEIRGLAWSGRGRIQRVEVGTDQGRSWTRRSCRAGVPKAHTFRLLWHGTASRPRSWPCDRRYRLRKLNGGPSVNPRPSHSLHLNPVTGWTIGADGRMLFAVGSDSMTRVCYMLIAAAFVATAGRRRSRLRSVTDSESLRHRAHYAARHRRAARRNRPPAGQSRVGRRRGLRSSVRRVTAQRARVGRLTLVGANPQASPFGPQYEQWRRDRPDVPFTVGNFWHATTLFDYVRRAMPPRRQGAFIRRVWRRRGCSRETASSPTPSHDRGACQVVMPARRFVPDDRRVGGKWVGDRAGSQAQYHVVAVGRVLSDPPSGSARRSSSSAWRRRRLD